MRRARCLAFEAADRFAVGLAFGCLRATNSIVSGWQRARDNDAVNRRVDLAVAAVIETVPVGPA
jgi:hypothetical protein